MSTAHATIVHDRMPSQALHVKVVAIANSLGIVNSMLTDALREEGARVPTNPHRVAAYEAAAKEVYAQELSILDLPPTMWRSLGADHETGEFIHNWITVLARDCDEVYRALGEYSVYTDCPNFSYVRERLKDHADYAASFVTDAEAFSM
jgi:hypothetical protein